MKKWAEREAAQETCNGSHSLWGSTADHSGNQLWMCILFCSRCRLGQRCGTQTARRGSKPRRPPSVHVWGSEEVTATWSRKLTLGAWCLELQSELQSEFGIVNHNFERKKHSCTRDSRHIVLGSPKKRNLGSCPRNLVLVDLSTCTVEFQPTAQHKQEESQDTGWDCTRPNQLESGSVLVQGMAGLTLV